MLYSLFIVFDCAAQEMAVDAWLSSSDDFDHIPWHRVRQYTFYSRLLLAISLEPMKSTLFNLFICFCFFFSKVQVSRLSSVG